jgi:tetratricopeptide (TPR) repeat protein
MFLLQRHRTPLFPLAAAMLIFATLSLLSGCQPSGPGEESGSPSAETREFANPVGSMKIAMRNRNWQEAWAAAEYILNQAESESSEKTIEPDTLILIAHAAHQTGRPEQAATLLERACIANDYADPKRVQQTFIAMVGVGQFYEGMELLEEALRRHPDQLENRRWLFDFYIGADDRVSAIPHGQQLIRARKFDLQLLLAISNTERRTLDAKPLDQMVERNPDDKRPLLGTAKTKFDENKLSEAIEILREITASHPEHHPSQAVLGQALAAAGRYAELEQWAAQQTPGIERYPGYWIALGDWARARSTPGAAVRAFAEATRSGDPDVIQIWTRLATLLPAFNASESSLKIDNATLTQVNERAQQLSRFNQLKDRFNRTGAISRAIALDIAKTLETLGRPWESEAWAALALTLPEDNSVDVAGFRNRIVEQLNDDLAWRSGAAMPDFESVFTNLALPEIETVVSAGAMRKPEIDQETLMALDLSAGETVAGWQVENEAAQRGLKFFGRTGDKLDQPGIMLYQTLGCGGGTIDFDRDGWSDLYFAAAGGTPPEKDSAPNGLFRNQDGDFVPVAGLAGVDDRGFGQGVTVGDVNEDGFADMLVLNYGPNRLYLNNGDGTFTDASDQMPRGDIDEWSSSGAIADLDADGLADIVIVNYCAGLGPVTQACPMKDSDIIRSCTPMLFAAKADRFLHNEGAGSFRDVTERWNAVPDSPGRGLGIVVGDLDGTPGNEIFVANDMTNNHYYGNAAETPQPFAVSESAMLRGMAADDRGIPQGSMGIATADLDHDGDLDFYVTNFDKEYNTLHMQSSPGLWQDKTTMAGLVDDTRPLVGFGTEALDLDLDGRSELVIANGHVDMFSRGDERALYAQPLQIFRLTGSANFQSVAVAPLGDYFSGHHVGRSLWTVDANRDGRIDLAVTHQTEPVALLINRCKSAGHWIRLDLVGTSASRDAVGSVVKISTPSSRLTGFKLSGSGYQCSNDPVLHLGLGKLEDSQVDVTVRWPDGVEQSFEKLGVDATHSLIQRK